eukprot:TRINITY_DN15884_c0_g1_i1.p1 TRINITY_DN15884_c0_g1~~TRINITY_DN15884_c0_g1_i1.p1  ORF type:complete len:119 (+),score=6.43 TRINITY_DN15884_c0_g1_i1:34-357(+)
MQRKDFKQPHKTPAPERDYLKFQTECLPLLKLLSSRYDLVYDPLHCVALVLQHVVFHACYWCSTEYNNTDALVQIFKKHTSMHTFFPSQSVKPGRDDWRLSNNHAKV